MSKTDPTIRAAIYCRISKDSTGEGLGVDRQESDCRTLAERLGWEVVAVFTDNDISAYSGKVRPQYRAMLAAVRVGQVRGVLAWHPDRLYRRAVDLEEIVSIAEAHHLSIATVTSGDVDLSTPTGRMNARIIGAVAQGEVERTRERVRAAKAQAADAGQWRGGPRPYGFEADGVRIREREARVIRHATKAVLAGRTLAGVVNELNGQGHRTSFGNEWSRHSLRDVLLRPRNAGLIHTGRVRRDLERGGKAVWDPIVDQEQFDAVERLLLDPLRRTNPGTTESRWIGSGIYLCGREGCTSVLRSFTVPRGGGKGSRGKPARRLPAYRCQENDHLTIMALKTDEHVRGVVADLVRDERVVAGLTAGEADASRADRERRQVLALRLEQIDSDYDQGVIDGQRHQRATRTVSAEMEEIEIRLADAAQQAAILPVFSALDPGQAFLDSPIDVQRVVLRAVLKVEVLPYQGQRGAAWSADRLVLTPAT